MSKYNLLITIPNLNRYFIHYCVVFVSFRIAICGKSVLGRGDYLMSYLPMKASSNRN